MAVNFNGGAKLKAALDKLSQKVKDGAHVQVGIFEKSTYPDGTPVAYIASVQEFGGTIEIPERQQEVYRSLNKSGGFNRNGRFVRKDKSNFATTHTIPAHTVIIPARPFMRNTIENNSGEWGARLGNRLEDTNFNVGRSLAAMGRDIADQMRDEIGKIEPQNAPSTIRKKGFDRPLVDTGRLRNSLSYEVKDGPDES